MEEDPEKPPSSSQPGIQSLSSSSNSSSSSLPSTTIHYNIPSEEPELITVNFSGPEDPTSPYNFSTLKKSLILLSATLTSLNSTLSSTLASPLFPYLQSQFSVPSGPQTVLPASLYLVGFVFGPLIFAPLSEQYGRKPILITGFTLFLLSTLGSVLSTQWWTFLLFRFFAGTFGSPPLSIYGGVIADCWKQDVTRGRMLMVWSAATFVGPLGAPVLGGFVAPVLGWRWVFWIALIYAGVSFISVLLLPETLASRILQKKASKLNKKNVDRSKRFVAPADLGKKSKTTLLRPLQLIRHEMLIILTSLYIAFIYALFYMLVQIIPAVFKGIYGFSSGVTGLLFTIIGAGTIIGCFICWLSDPITMRLSERLNPQKKQEHLRLPLACIGGPIFVVSILWFGLTSRENIHWAVPFVALFPYGIAYNIIWVAMINYVADAYGIYSASALAALGTTRSVGGALIPLAVEDMIKGLGVAKSCVLLAGISAALSAVPFCFIAYGDKIRAASRFSTAVKTEMRQQDEGLARTTSLSAV
ncbi:major facilitator superfamily domain-containing protein [Podospora fimiseda]|uniref:Major facilitator superfamily domain-containing protein n=1 Tax=Podospora fimiseda TaxID=252190 RepID=A0AAN7BMK4_9PEZI|nr:major facilitator superfamily domain-containing protein [Podospora fimiseda]